MGRAAAGEISRVLTIGDDDPILLLIGEAFAAPEQRDAVAAASGVTAAQGR